MTWQAAVQDLPANPAGVLLATSSTSPLLSHLHCIVFPKRCWLDQSLNCHIQYTLTSRPIKPQSVLSVIRFHEPDICCFIFSTVLTPRTLLKKLNDLSLRN